MRMNKENATKQISFTLILSIVAMAINYMISFVLTPYITTNMGAEAFGFVSLAKTIANYGIIATGCLNAFAARYITIAYHKDDIEKANTYFSSVVIANIGLLLITIIFEVFFIYNIQVFIKIPTNLVSDVKVLFALDITNYMLLALANTFTVSAYIKNKLGSVETNNVITYLTQVIVLIVLYKFLPIRVSYVGVGLIISTLVLFVLNIRLSKKYTPELKVKKEIFSWRAVKKLVLSGIWNSINSVGNLLNSGLDLWVSNLMLSALEMGNLSIVKTVSTILSSLEQLLSRPFQPYLLKKYSNGDSKGVAQILNFEIMFSGYFSSMIFAGLITFGSLYYKLWTPTQDSMLLYGITVVTVVGFLFEGIVQPLFYTYTLTLKNRIPCYVTIGSGILNVIGMYVLLKYTNLGLYAVVGTTTVLGFITFMIFTPIYSAHCLGLKWNVFYLGIFRVLSAAVVITLVLKTLFMNFMPSTWIGLIVSSLCSCIIGVPIFMFIVLDKENRNLAINKLKKFREK